MTPEQANRRARRLTGKIIISVAPAGPKYGNDAFGMIMSHNLAELIAAELVDVEAHAVRCCTGMARERGQHALADFMLSWFNTGRIN